MGRSSSPRAWGCFQAKVHGALRRQVFPTCVGVFLRRTRAVDVDDSLPHVRGGVSMWDHDFAFCPWSSPRAWGCFYNWSPWLMARLVFPTCVGVFPTLSAGVYSDAGLPHVRGGVSQLAPVIKIDFGSSPRAWGCFRPN